MRAIKARPKSLQKQAPTIHRLFLDFNSAVHRFVKDDSTNETVIENSCQYLEQIIQHTKPRDLIFVALDGVAPLAKVFQQRSRRYMSSKFKNQNGSFDRTCITAGTPFMTELSHRLHATCEKITVETGVTTIFSGSTIPGEGEQKIVSHIRQKPSNGTDCIYGLDADLILLSMTLNDPGLTILREHKEFNKTEEGFVYLDIDTIIDYVLQSVNIDEDRNQKILTHILVSFFIGNDFVPGISCFKVQNLDDFHCLITTPLVDSTGKIDWDEVVKFIDALSNREDEAFKSADEKYWSAKPSPDKIDDQYPLVHKDESKRTIRPGTPFWRHRYYDSLFETKNVTEICKEYLIGIQWTFDYYTQSGPCPAWFYPHAYGPTALDLKNYILSKEDIASDLETTRLPIYDFNPSRSLLMVVPPSSFDVLPENLQKIARRIDSGIAHTFPIDFKINTYLKIWTHECKPKLPSVEIENLKSIT